MDGPISCSTPQECLEMPCRVSADMLPAPGISRSMMYLGMKGSSGLKVHVAWVGQLLGQSPPLGHTKMRPKGDGFRNTFQCQAFQPILRIMHGIGGHACGHFLFPNRTDFIPHLYQKETRKSDVLAFLPPDAVATGRSPSMSPSHSSA
jgi:hypothetical protein